jgi:hypothetical protein
VSEQPLTALEENACDGLRTAARALLAKVEPIPLAPGMKRTPTVRYDDPEVVALREALDD